MTTIGNVYDFLPSNGQDPEKIIFLLHGLGSNGQDLISLAPYWARYIPDAVFVSPDAPFPCDMAPMGYQWFSLQDRDEKIMLEGVQKAVPILESFIEKHIEKYNVPAHKCALVGFSQGTMMSLYAAPRYREELAGVLGYSGALIGESNLDKESQNLHHPPIHLIHGEADMVVPVTAWHHAKGVLERNDFQVTGYTQPGLIHSIDEKGIESGGKFLEQILK